MKNKHAEQLFDQVAKAVAPLEDRPTPNELVQFVASQRMDGIITKELCSAVINFCQGINVLGTMDQTDTSSEAMIGMIELAKGIVQRCADDKEPPQEHKNDE